MVWFLYQFIHFLYELYSTNSYNEPRARAARGEARAHLQPRPGRTRLPRRLGYTRLLRPVRVRSWGGWVRNGIKVYNLYYRLPRPLGYTRLPRPVRVRSWGGWVRNGITIRKSGLYSLTRVAYSTPFTNEFTKDTVWKNVPNCSSVNLNVGYLLRVITTLAVRRHYIIWRCGGDEKRR
jgi:hypothetical protein